MLIDTSRSFQAAAIDAVQAATGSDLFTSAEVRMLKEIRGFNDDWHVALAGAAWVLRADHQAFPEFARSVDAAGGGLDGLAAVIGGPLPRELVEKVTRLAMEAYGGSTACRQLFGFTPVTLKGPGRWREEIPLLAAGQIQPLEQRAGIVTGRSRLEMELAFQVLEWRLPEAQVAVADDPAGNKPNPAKLLGILDQLGSRRAIYAGDSRDDLELARNAQRAGAAVDFCYIGPGPTPWDNVEHSFRTVTEMLAAIKVDNG